MNYLILSILLYPIFLLLRIFRKRSNDILIIQTAKIGDYINSTILFDELKPFDVAINTSNLPLAENDPRISSIFLINKTNKKTLMKLVMMFRLFWRSYDKIYVLVPNSYNLFLARNAYPKKCTAIKTYATKWYERRLMSACSIVEHSIHNLTLDTYLRLLGKRYQDNRYRKSLPETLLSNNTPLLSAKKTLKVGISIAAGNKSKILPASTWDYIFQELDKINCEIYLFGTKDERDYFQYNYKAIEHKFIDLIGKISLREVPAYLSKMNLYISSDSGNAYISDCYDIPLIWFPGPCFSEEQHPVGQKILAISPPKKMVPKLFVFKTPPPADFSRYYSINNDSKKMISAFIEAINTDFLFSQS